MNKEQKEEMSKWAWDSMDADGRITVDQINEYLGTYGVSKEIENGIRYSWDGDMICAVKDDDFINLQESPAGFGKTKTEACANLVLSCVDHFQDWLKGRPNDLDYQRQKAVGLLPERDGETE